MRKRPGDRSHFVPYVEVGTLRGHPRCQAFKRGSTEQCGNRAEIGFEVCKFHGANAAKRNVTHGQNQAVFIKTRKQFIEALGNDKTTDFAKQMIDKLREIALAGSLEALKYSLDQLFGSPKATVVTEIADRDLFARMVRVTAKHLTGEAFQAWLSDLKTEMQDDSDLTNLSHLPSE